MKRKELDLLIDHTGMATPPVAAFQQLLAKELKTAPEKIEVKNIFSLFGAAKANSKVYIWDENKVEDLNKPKEEVAAEPAKTE